MSKNKEEYALETLKRYIRWHEGAEVEKPRFKEIKYAVKVVTNYIKQKEDENRESK